MNLPDKILLRKLTIVLVVKLAVLMALWWFFVREHRVSVDGNSVATQFLAPAPTGAKGTRP